MELVRTENRSPIAFVLKAAALAAFLTTVFSALLIATLSALNSIRETTAPSVLGIIRSAFWLCPITAASCGSFGFVAGIAGSALLNWRRHRIRSTSKLLLEAGVAGFLLACLFPFFDRLMNPTSLNGIQILLSAPMGVFCALICAFTLRNHFIKE